MKAMKIDQQSVIEAFQSLSNFRLIEIQNRRLMRRILLIRSIVFRFNKLLINFAAINTKSDTNHLIDENELKRALTSV